jgi:hypothetical protein
MAASPSWNGIWTAPAATGTPYSHPSARPYDADDGPSWPGIVLSIAIGVLVLAAVFAGLLPFPLVGIIVLIIVRGIFNRFD